MLNIDSTRTCEKLNKDDKKLENLKEKTGVGPARPTGHADASRFASLHVIFHNYSLWKLCSVGDSETNKQKTKAKCSEN